jgi:hypothetical protein
MLNLFKDTELAGDPSEPVRREHDFIHRKKIDGGTNIQEISHIKDGVIQYDGNTHTAPGVNIRDSVGLGFPRSSRSSWAFPALLGRFRPLRMSRKRLLFPVHNLLQFLEYTATGWDGPIVAGRLPKKRRTRPRALVVKQLDDPKYQLDRAYLDHDAPLVSSTLSWLLAMS